MDKTGQGGGYGEGNEPVGASSNRTVLCKVICTGDTSGGTKHEGGKTDNGHGR